MGNKTLLKILEENSPVLIITGHIANIVYGAYIGFTDSQNPPSPLVRSSVIAGINAGIAGFVGYGEDKNPIEWAIAGGTASEIGFWTAYGLFYLAGKFF